MRDNKQILLTGATGFLGKYIIKELSRFGTVDTVGRSGATYNVDLSSGKPALNKRYDLVVHNAGKAHSIPVTEYEKQLFYDVNFTGTENLLSSLESAGIPGAFIFISSVAVYGLDTGINISEEHQLNATEPYGRSKILAEQLLSAWCKENNVVCSILRLPLIAGENAPGNLQAMINSIKKGYYFNIAGGKAHKSIVLAQDVAEILLRVSETGGIYNLTDGCHPSFQELAVAISVQLNRKAPTVNMPLAVASILGKVGDLLGQRAPINSLKLQKITSDLTFNDDKARNMLDWKPTAVTAGLRL
jgi:nucleoside-diphosphate-sugar epimerase